MSQQPGNIQRTAFFEFGGIELQITNDPNIFDTTTQFAKALRVSIILATDASEPREERTKEEAETFIAIEGAFRESGIYEEGRNVEIVGGPEKIRPDLRFDQDNRLRMMAMKARRTHARRSMG